MSNNRNILGIRNPVQARRVWAKAIRRANKAWRKNTDPGNFAWVMPGSGIFPTIWDLSPSWVAESHEGGGQVAVRSYTGQWYLTGQRLEAVACQLPPHGKR